MSERTGATDAQIEAMAKQFHNLGQTDPEDYNPWDSIGRNEKAAVRDWVEDIVCAAIPPGMVIARAADVLTTEQRAAIGRIHEYCRPESEDVLVNWQYDEDDEDGERLWNDDLAVLRAIAEGGIE